METLQVKNSILHSNLNYQDYKEKFQRDYSTNLHFRSFQVLKSFFEAIQMDFLFSDNLSTIKYNFMVILNSYFIKKSIHFRLNFNQFKLLG